MVSELIKLRHCDVCGPAFGRESQAATDLPEIWTVGEDQDPVLLDVCNTCGDEITLASFVPLLTSLGRPCDARGRPTTPGRRTKPPGDPPRSAGAARQLAAPPRPVQRPHEYPCLCCDRTFRNLAALSGHLHDDHAVNLALIFTDSRCALCGTTLGTSQARGVAQHSRMHGDVASAVDSYRQALDAGDQYGVVKAALRRATITRRDVAG